MKSLLFLSLVGAAIYAVLLYSNPLPAPNPSVVAVQAEATPPAVTQPSSWGSDIGSLKPQIVSVPKPPTRWYDRKPRQDLRYVDETAEAETPAKTKPAAAALKPKTVAAGRTRPQPQIADRVEVKRAEVRRPRLSRRAERRTRKAYNNRAFLLGR
jgi:hypothetical protein